MPGSTMVSLAAFPGGDVARSNFWGIDTCLVSPNKIPDDVKETQTDKHQIISIALHGLFLFFRF